MEEQAQEPLVRLDRGVTGEDLLQVRQRPQQLVLWHPGHPEGGGKAQAEELGVCWALPLAGLRHDDAKLGGGPAPRAQHAEVGGKADAQVCGVVSVPVARVSASFEAALLPSGRPRVEHWVGGAVGEQGWPLGLLQPHSEDVEHQVHNALADVGAVGCPLAEHVVHEEADLRPGGADAVGHAP